MKREIKFRGKVVHNDPMTNPDDGWVYGFYYQDLDKGEIKHYIKSCPMDWEVIHETVGQFTGLWDRHGNEIYEGDIVEWYYTPETKSTPFIVEFQHGAFGYVYCGEFHSFEGNGNFDFRLFDTDKRFTLIGNIHDNPELLNK